MEHGLFKERIEELASKLGTALRGELYPIDQFHGYSGNRAAADSTVVNAGELVNKIYNEFDLNANLREPIREGDVSNFEFEHFDHELGTYWFHPDHTSTPLSTGLGSSNYITNLDGNVSQHMECLPFGETLAEEHLNSNNSPYKFNGKQLDEETGNYYYGARYYDPKTSIWLSVDPMTEKFPGVVAL